MCAPLLLNEWLMHRIDFDCETIVYVPWAEWIMLRRDSETNVYNTMARQSGWWTE